LQSRQEAGTKRPKALLPQDERDKSAASDKHDRERGPYHGAGAEGCRQVADTGVAHSENANGKRDDENIKSPDDHELTAEKAHHEPGLLLLPQRLEAAADSSKSFASPPPVLRGGRGDDGARGSRKEECRGRHHGRADGEYYAGAAYRQQDAGQRRR
jgi:hypothetical protein